MSARMRSLPALTRAIESRDPCTEGHGARLRVRTRARAELDCSPRELEAIRLAAPVHDIGKLAIQDAMLLKPGPLDEQNLVCAHLEAGARLLRAMERMADAIPVVLSHHERWDGGGFPVGLAGPEIPLEARVLAVADAFDAMTSSRPYRDALPHAAAIEELERCAGSQFDPKGVAAFVEAWRDGDLDADARSPVRARVL